MEEVAPEGGHGPDGSFAAAIRAMDEGRATHELTVLPMETSASGLAVYHEAVIDLVKELRADGADVDYAHPSAERSFYAERSAEIAIAFIVNIASSAAWEYFMFKLDKYRATKRLSVTLVDETAADGSASRAATFDGSGDDVIKALGTYLDKK